MPKPKCEFVIVHNIPSPYRLYLFGLLKGALEKVGITLRVLMMARGHRDRPHWEDLQVAAGYELSFYSDYGISIGTKEWHFNPRILGELINRRPSYVMVGGPWDSMTSALASLLPIGDTSIAWFEGNSKTPGRVAGLSRRIKHLLLKRYTRIAVPGEEGVRLAEMIAGSTVRSRTVILPNLIDEKLFKGGRGDAENRLRQEYLNDPSHDRLAIWNARLIPAKGVVEFLSHLERDDLRGWKVIIFGEGPLQAEIEQTMHRKRFGNTLHLRPYIPYDQMPEVYRAADLMLLPSIHDPNPLSIVEAMHAGLPLLVSHRIGNHPEAIAEGENGWTIDPANADSIRDGIEKAFRASSSQLREMGECSRQRADEHWNSERAISKFLCAIGITKICDL